MALAPLSECSQQDAGSGASDEGEISRGYEGMGEAIIVDANESGTYTVTITDENLFLDEAFAEGVPEVVTAEEAGVEEEMTRDEVEPEVEEAEPEGAAEEDAEAEVVAEPEQEGETEQAAEPEAVEADGAEADGVEAVEAEPEDEG